MESVYIQSLIQLMKNSTKSSINTFYIKGYTVEVENETIISVNEVPVENLETDFIMSLEDLLPENQLMKQIESGERVELELEDGKYKVRFEDGELQGINGLQLRSFSDDFILAIYDKLKAEYGI